MSWCLIIIYSITCIEINRMYIIVFLNCMQEIINASSVIYKYYFSRIAPKINHITEHIVRFTMVLITCLTTHLVTLRTREVCCN